MSHAGHSHETAPDVIVTDASAQGNSSEKPPPTAYPATSPTIPSDEKKSEADDSPGLVDSQDVGEGVAGGGGGGAEKQTTTKKKKKKDAITHAIGKFVLCHVTWIPPIVKDWAKMKPVLRSALMAWLCMLMLLISPIEIAMGNASFLILVGAFIAPCENPPAGIIEREFFILLLTCIAWAYANLGIFFAHLARHNRVPPNEATAERIYTGYYIEAGPSAICTVFLALGVAISLYLKVKFGPSPFLFACILACIMLDITLIYAPLFPYPMYTLGQTVIVPLALKAAINIVVSFLFLPKSVNSSFVERLNSVLQPLNEASSKLHTVLLNQSPTDPDFDFLLMHNQVTKAEAGLLPLRGAARLLTREVSFSLANGEDLKSLVRVFVAMLAPADGISLYFVSIKSDIHGVDIHMHPHVSKFNTPIPTRPQTPSASQTASRAQSRRNSHEEERDTGMSTSVLQHYQKKRSHEHSSSSSIRTGSPAAFMRRHSHDLRHRLHHVLHSHSSSRRPSHHGPVEVGLWESLRYTVVESQLHSRRNDRYTNLCFRLLGEVSGDLLQAQSAALTAVQQWLIHLNRARLRQFRRAVFFQNTENTTAFGHERAENGASPKTLQEVIKDLERVLDEFKTRKGPLLEPFRSSVGPPTESEEGQERIPHRYLFQCFTFCYFQQQYTHRLIEFIKALHKIEEERTRWQFWLPKVPKLLTVEAWKGIGEAEDDHDAEHDEDPDTIPGATISTLGQTEARDPEALPWDQKGSNQWLQKLAISLTRFTDQIFRGNSLFMIKAAIITVLVALPSILRSSAGWSYANKAIWTVIMAQLSLARHRGEVLFSLASRVMATFFGAIMGMLIWYIASGSGIANPYALAVVTAIGFVFVMFIRLYLPAPPITSIITCVTTALVVGYSWQDAKNPSYGSPGKGWDVTWRRFIEVVIGATAAYIIAVLPPSNSMRRYYRLSHATTISELGGMYCQAVTLAAMPPDPVESRKAIDNLIAIRAKLRRLMILKANISYEWSLRGPWPVKRYEELEEIEMQFSKLLTHAIVICENLGPTYSRALLRRTHFLDPVFLADCIAILTMCTTALRTGRPLPQIVPVLIDRYLSNAPGFQIHNLPQGHEALSTMLDGEDDQSVPGLPKVVTFDTLCKDEYQMFAVGVMVAFGLVIRLDRLCLAVKELVGETYAVPTEFQFEGHS